MFIENRKKLDITIWEPFWGRLDIHSNNIYYKNFRQNDTQHERNKHKGIQRNDTNRNDTQDRDERNPSKSKSLSRLEIFYSCLTPVISHLLFVNTILPTC